MHVRLGSGYSGGMRWRSYVRRLSDGDNQVTISKRTGIDQGTISRWLRDGTPSPAHAAKFAQTYGGSVLEAFVAAGFLTPEEAGAPPRVDVAFEEIVEADPRLSDGAKTHLQTQYGLLIAASAHERMVRLRQVIERNEELDEETRRNLLALLSREIHLPTGSGKTETLMLAMQVMQDAGVSLASPDYPDDEQRRALIEHLERMAKDQLNAPADDPADETGDVEDTQRTSG